jgi:glycine dehydrogenase
MTRYLHRLQSKDIGLEHHMIPLGSCTMKLNSATEMFPLTWPEFADVHPFAPDDQKEGYIELVRDLEHMLADITQFHGCSLQPNSGAAGEYVGMLTIRNYLAANGQKQRNVCLIPQSAHGTNPASATMAGFQVVTVKCDSKGNIDLEDFKKKCEEHKNKLACIMVTYPSTYGLFEEGILELIETTHRYGAQVYMDGANMNAQVGITAPGRMGADVCHLNLHKTFAMPHGGGGPGVGPVCCAAHLTPYLPSHSIPIPGRFGGAAASAQHGSANLLPISWMYIKMLGSKGLTQSTEFAILNANYMAAKLKDHYQIVYTGKNGTSGHEFIIDCRPFKKFGVEAKDIAKRLMDYGFHGPTMSFPVTNTLMVEPTECESIQEINRMCDAFIQIRQEIRDIEEGRMPKNDNPLVNAPHTAEELASEEWNHPYSRAVAAFPLNFVKNMKHWPSVKRVNDTFGDLHLKTTLDSFQRYDD